MWPFSRKAKQPEVALQAQPIAINPSKSERSDRNEQRMARLELAIAQTTNGDVLAKLQAELARRKHFGK